MGRKKKEHIKPSGFRTYQGVSIEKGQILECPVCHQKFEVTEETNYIIPGGFTCTWECFLKYHRQYMKEHPPKGEN